MRPTGFIVTADTPSNPAARAGEFWLLRVAGVTAEVEVFGYSAARYD
jgi:hypothetical protein